MIRATIITLMLTLASTFVLPLTRKPISLLGVTLTEAGGESASTNYSQSLTAAEQQAINEQIEAFNAYVIRRNNLRKAVKNPESFNSYQDWQDWIHYRAKFRDTNHIYNRADEPDN